MQSKSTTKLLFAVACIAIAALISSTTLFAQCAGGGNKPMYKDTVESGEEPSISSDDAQETGSMDEEMSDESSETTEDIETMTKEESE